MGTERRDVELANVSLHDVHVGREQSPELFQLEDTRQLQQCSCGRLYLSQEQAAERLSQFHGTEWSVASWSAAERGYERPDKVRNFGADLIVAFSVCFDLPAIWFFIPPPDHEYADVFLHQTIALTPEYVARVYREHHQAFKAIVGDTTRAAGLMFDTSPMPRDRAEEE